MMKRMDVKSKLLCTEDILPIYNLLKTNIIRSHVVMTVVFLQASSSRSDIESQVSQFLMSKVRNTDLLFKLEEEMEWGIILMQSGEKEARAFLDRINQSVDETLFTFRGIIFEIRNDKAEFEHLYFMKTNIFLEGRKEKGFVSMTTFTSRPIETIKISILEENAIFREVLKTTIEKINMNHIKLQIQCFVDGFDFLQSDWYKTSHTHIVIMNDILPRKNGLEVLHTLRNMPNQKKFIIYMMTRSNSESGMIQAYESGIDHYLIKPFNLRLFEAQLKRTFARIRV